MLKVSMALFSVLLLIVAVSFFVLDEDELMIAMNDRTDQQKVLDGFKNRDVPHRVDNKGRVFYLAEYEEAAKKLFNEAMGTDTTSIITSDQRHSDDVISKLDQHNIEYKVVANNGRTEIIWFSSQTEKVHKLLNIELVSGPQN